MICSKHSLFLSPHPLPILLLNTLILTEQQICYLKEKGFSQMIKIPIKCHFSHKSLKLKLEKSQQKKAYQNPYISDAQQPDTHEDDIIPLKSSFSAIQNL